MDSKSNLEGSATETLTSDVPGYSIATILIVLVYGIVWLGLPPQLKFGVAAPDYNYFPFLVT